MFILDKDGISHKLSTISKSNNFISGEGIIQIAPVEVLRCPATTDFEMA
jgi:hypothetical protein